MRKSKSLAFFIFTFTLLIMSKAMGVSVECQVNITEISKPELIQSRTPGSNDMMGTRMAVRAVSDGDRLKIETQGTSQDWSLAKEFNEDRGKVKLLLNANYYPAFYDQEQPDVKVADDYLGLKFSVLEEDKTIHTAKLGITESKETPTFFSLGVDREFDFGGEYKYSFEVSCSKVKKPKG